MTIQYGGFKQTLESLCAWAETISTASTPCLLFGGCVFESRFLAANIDGINDKCQICGTLVKNGLSINSLHKNLMKTAYYMKKKIKKNRMRIF